ncbi:multiple coagulation factor deficiency protein 2 homolog isoform X1 [Neodiprion virginianus]|uniref:multiple coagulation factor deficiency protein 2 homolog isoform X1 n=1 Tax=Neodiprion virginianus TaxID=2961670 RepID=UPI001EE76157|nr:multiple coagulation factor deficiency protein 2 homolog isoform X1 [Neodiprion virginianus]
MPVNRKEIMRYKIVTDSCRIFNRTINQPGRRRVMFENGGKRSFFRISVEGFLDLGNVEAKMLLLVLAGLFVEFSVGFRGPHHPKSGISHHHYAPQKDGLKLTQDAELLHDASHLKEDLGALADQLDLSKMSDQELEFYYFNFHDIDNNTKLDGLEILNAILHTLHQHEGDERTEYETARENLEELPRIIDLIDNVLEEDDLDNDGYLGYIEYVLGRQRDENTEAKRDKKLIIP